MHRGAAFGGTLASLFTVTALVAWKNGGINSHGHLDTAMFIAFLVFMAWLLTPGKNNASGGKKPGQGIAFRLGQSLRSIWRRD